MSSAFNCEIVPGLVVWFAQTLTELLTHPEISAGLIFSQFEWFFFIRLITTSCSPIPHSLPTHPKNIDLFLELWEICHDGFSWTQFYFILFFWTKLGSWNNLCWAGGWKLRCYIEIGTVLSSKQQSAFIRILGLLLRIAAFNGHFVWFNPARRTFYRSTRFFPPLSLDNHALFLS